MHPRLELYHRHLGTIQELFFEGAALLLADTETVLESLPSEKIHFKIKGMTIDRFKDSVSYKALMTGLPVKEERGPEAFGFPYYSKAVPIFDEDGKTAVGVIAAITTNETVSKLREEATHLSAVVEEMTAMTVQITEGSKDLSEEVKGFAAVSHSMAEDIKQVHKALEFVQEIANQSNLLGLNAAIEAARAGEAGKGFSVVAQEIRKMADVSKETSGQIRELLKSIQSSTDRFGKLVQSISRNTDSQAGSLAELNKAFEQIAMTADNLANQG
ncbi:methyl-accepting chemotaxis protein [Cohnella candidum]|uniref:Methyl-accepting transducer domain-containing protein n=1 Tax=Cohnella candidum TaxID=2674991 RepID=A0A3G3K099_9BACL|nr:methyl-accepting chemotaxis protein [Cohnella candidum]AYQ73934.1 hypothetical protein EAV92_15925 [Cohnella candidum]